MLFSTTHHPLRALAYSRRLLNIRWVTTSARRSASEYEHLFSHSTPSSWRSAEPRRIDKSSFLDMLDGRLPAIYEKAFVSRERCKMFEDHLQPKLSPYTHIAGPRVDKVGLAQFEFQAQSAEDFKKRATDTKDRYFSEVEKVKSLHHDIAQVTGENTWTRVFGMLKSMFPEFDVTLAREKDGRYYHAGIYRCINDSTPIHCDWSPYDSKTEDWIVNRITRQAVFNLYLAPMVDGETIIYEKQWTEDVLEHRDPDTYGYFPSAVEGRACTTVKPDVGDIVFFNTRHLHEVKAVGWEEHPQLGKWKRPRLTFSAFIGLLPAGIISGRPTMILWS